MKIEKLFFSVLVALLLIPAITMGNTNDKIRLDRHLGTNGGRTSVPSVDATQYSDYILLDINRYYGNVVVEVENEETGETVSSEYFVCNRDSFTFNISTMPEGIYIIRLHFDNGMEYVGQFTIEIEY